MLARRFPHAIYYKIANNEVTVHRITADHFHRQFNLNVLGLILTTQESSSDIITTACTLRLTPMATRQHGRTSVHQIEAISGGEAPGRDFARVGSALD